MTDTGKVPWIVRIPTPVWLLGLIVVALLVDRALELPAVFAHRPAGAALIIAGVALSVWAALTFRRQRAEIVPSSETHSTLIASGPFRFSRNPMYLGALAVGVGAALLAGAWPMWLVPAALFFAPELRDHPVRGVQHGAHVRRRVSPLSVARPALDLGAQTRRASNEAGYAGVFADGATARSKFVSASGREPLRQLVSQLANAIHVAVPPMSRRPTCDANRNRPPHKVAGCRRPSVRQS